MTPTPDDDLLPVIAKAVARGRPLDLLGLASATLAIVLHPRKEPTVDDELRQETVVQELVQRYAAVGTSASTAFALALTALVPGEALRRRLRSSLDGAEDEVPRWVADLDAARLERTTVVRDLYDDDEWLLAELRLADDQRFAFRVEIDHDADGVLADAMLMPTTVDAVCERLKASSPDDVAFLDVTPEDFAARFAEAVALADANPERERTDTWPSSRPLVEWALRQVPTDRRTSG